MKYSRKIKKGLSKKYYKKKSHRFTKKKYGGNNYGSSLAKAPTLPHILTIYPNTVPNMYHTLDQNSIRSIGLNSPKFDEYNFLSELQSSSDGNGNKGPPNYTTQMIQDFKDDDPRDKYEEYIIPLNENGILELGKALTKLGLNPQNILDVLKKQVAISKKNGKLNKIKKIIHLIDREFSIIDYSLQKQIITTEQANEYKTDILNNYLTLSN